MGVLYVQYTCATHPENYHKQGESKYLQGFLGIYHVGLGRLKIQWWQHRVGSTPTPGTRSLSARRRGIPRHG